MIRLCGMWLKFNVLNNFASACVASFIEKSANKITHAVSVHIDRLFILIG
jgi:hypothetical protein